MSFEQRLSDAAQQYAHAHAERDDAIRDASRHGHLTYKRIGELVGLSPQRVHQIIHAAPHAADQVPGSRTPS